jgi:predicted extracellular nuclease
MTSTPVNLLSLRSGLNSDRPKPATLQLGQLAVNYGANEPGVYLEDTGGAIRKIGSSHYGTTAPNATPAGQTGNSVGETWVDSSASTYFMKVWTGSTWQTIGSAFATSANSANSALSASSAVIASGAILASGSYYSVIASGATAASGSYSAILSSGCIKASGVPVTTGLPVSSPEGTVMYQAAAPSGLYIYVGGQWVQI